MPAVSVADGYLTLTYRQLSGGQGTPANRVQVLVSQGNVPFEDVPSLWTTGPKPGDDIPQLGKCFT